MNPLNLLLNPLVLVLATGLFPGILAITMACRIKSSGPGRNSLLGKE